MESQEFKTIMESYEKKEKRSSRRLLWALLLPIAITAFLAYGIYKGYKASKEQITAVKTEAQASKANDSLYEALARQRLLMEGWDAGALDTVSREDLGRSVEASLAHQKLVAEDSADIDQPAVSGSAPPVGGDIKKKRTVVKDSVIVRYYIRPKDNHRAMNELEDLGFIINEKEVEPGTEHFETNAIFYGSEVREKDVKLVAFTLMKAGFRIKHVEPFVEDPAMAWKSKAIEVGYKKDPIRKQAYDAKELQRDLLKK